jgi:hypothetical protein
MQVLVETEPPRQQAAGAERAERVRRYKEKRLSRLFAKRIRYEVRRLNAVRRPRFKVTPTSLPSLTYDTTPQFSIDFPLLYLSFRSLYLNRA